MRVARQRQALTVICVLLVTLAVQAQDSIRSDLWNSSGGCNSEAPPYYVVINDSSQDLTLPGTGCNPWFLKHPEVTDCMNQADLIDLEAELCIPKLSERVATDGFDPVLYEVCYDHGAPQGTFMFRIREWREDGSCPFLGDNPQWLEGLPPGTGGPGALLEIPAGVSIPPDTVLGELEAEYQPKMSRRASQAVMVTIRVPPELVSLAPLEVARIEIDPTATLGELETSRTTILVADTMRVELTSPSFEIEGQFPTKQQVDIQGTGEPTRWAWTIRAPDAAGIHVAAIRVYLWEDTSPSWLGSVEIEVVDLPPTPAPTSTPTSTPTPTPVPTPTPPALQRVIDGLIANPASILDTCCAAFAAVVVAAIAAYADIRNSRRQEKIQRLELERQAKQDQEEKGLEREIARLKSIRWWQFWRR